ncbi:probable RNA-binding protein 19 [Ictalurus furcatus]|uniref:probable RNA-binding protein 19 n=1 Tax=Ictalurus furcatus TaxID=66913 RepID=UPI00234FBD52|nr:probable RNA-binding protein 19 [Ictalurus furcatus]XP_053492040.1 probable RNA-binding protein 19 [Ictalurus furcatus]XP_053492041.1 probable RNA-binding protein 19 [Ictalurus furcatus]
MSRLIVKNLPNGMKEERFRKMFAAFGTLTDCGLKFTKDGKFRKFGFVGFKCEEDASKALKHFNKSFVDTARVTVEFCTDFGDPNKARPWSKHSRQLDRTKDEQKPEGEKRDENKGKKEKKPLDVLGELKNDEGFQEFLAVHKNRTQVPTWANDAVEAGTVEKSKETEKKKEKKAASDDYLNFDSDDSEDLSEDEEQGASEDEDEQDSAKVALKEDLSDMEYLRSKVVKKPDMVDEKEEDDEELVKEDNAKDVEEEEEGPMQQMDSANESGDKDIQKPPQNKFEPATEFTVKLRGVPFTVKEQQVREFMLPLKPVAIRIAKNKEGRNSGNVYVDLHSEAEVERALKLDKDYMGGRYIEVFRATNFTDKRTTRAAPQEKNFVSELKDDEEEEDVAESGRLFVRNLPYTCTEDELKELFTKHGHLSELNFPIDSLTKKPKGFAFVTYIIPENAVSALAQLDGHIFQGRILHIIPSRIKKEKPEQEPNAPGSSSYKRQKDAKDKAASGSSHNWNTLFLGTSAVADAIAEKYNTTKSKVLDHESQGSLAVRMALGETQIIQETRQFLLDNGVSLDSFSQASGQRSNSVILVKNLPSGVQAKELETLFSPHGSLGRVLLPPSGLTAIVEFLEPTEAKRAFTRLAYTKFQHVPLYLEWAPMAVFLTPPEQHKAAELEAVNKNVADQQTDANKKEEEDEEEDEEEEESLPGSTLFVKNVNYSTTEESLQETFSKCGELKMCSISKKRDKSGKLSSMGYGFIQYKTPKAAQKAIRQLQHCTVDGHQLELRISERELKSGVTRTSRKKQTAKKQTTSKILVRNVPFQTTVKELRELFCTFGELKTVRLPKKGVGGAHRGFAFVDFLTKQDAKKAFSALCHSTHLYGRRLVLEWADAEESVEELRRKTAQHFHDAPKKQKQAQVLEGILEQMEVGEGDE